MKVAGERFRCDGIPASGLASVMSDVGLTNGAFYAHFESKADRVRETVAAALEDLLKQVGDAIAAGGLAAAIAIYLSTADPAHGCSFAALLPELARELASALPPQTANPEATAMSVSATLIGTLQLARILEDCTLGPQSGGGSGCGAAACRATTGWRDCLGSPSAR